MSGSRKKRCPGGLHPETVAKRLKVHLRTIFRLHDRGTLRSISEESLIIPREQVDAILDDLTLSCTKKEAVRILGVTANTILAWSNEECGLLKTVQPLTQKRVLLSSIKAVLTAEGYHVTHGRWVFLRVMKTYKRKRLINSVKKSAEKIEKSFRGMLRNNPAEWQQERKSLLTPSAKMKPPKPGPEPKAKPETKAEKLQTARAEELKRFPDLSRWEKALTKKPLANIGAKNDDVRRLDHLRDPEYQTSRHLDPFTARSLGIHLPRGLSEDF